MVLYNEVIFPKIKEDQFNIKRYVHLLDKEITLSSGKKSNIYIDLRDLFNYIDDLSIFTEEYWEWIGNDVVTHNDIFNLIGLELWGLMMARELPHWQYTVGEGFRGYFLRKKKGHGIGKRFYFGDEFNPLDVNILIDDVLTSGGSVEESLDYIQGQEFKIGDRSFKVQIQKILVVVNRSEDPFITNINGIPIVQMFILNKNVLTKCELV